MDKNKKDMVGTIITIVFAYLLLFGLTKHVYDRKKHKLVYSRMAHFYSLAMHITFLALVPVLYRPAETIKYLIEYIHHSVSFLHEDLMFVIKVLCYATVILSMSLQWTLRRNAARFFNELFQLWHRDMAHLQSSRAVRRRSAGLFIFKVISLALTVSIIAQTTFQIVTNQYLALKCIHQLVLLVFSFTVMFLVCSGFVISQYLFGILNHNLALVVEEIGTLSATQMSERAVKLEEELNEIGRIHAQLQRWVVRFKNMYQVEILLIQIEFFTLQGIMLLALVMFSRIVSLHYMAFEILASFVSSIMFALEIASLCYISGRLLAASHEGGEIIKALPAQGISCIQLQRSIEMLSFQFKIYKLRLTICGMLDLEWSVIFAMTESAMLYIIFLVQAEYARVRRVPNIPFDADDGDEH